MSHFVFFALWEPFLVGKEDRFPGKHLPRTLQALEWTSHSTRLEVDFNPVRRL
jgi:hypothetical protein